jgi:8-oxo-dGTP pyrophosphatase MutT (NUDIX family)
VAAEPPISQECVEGYLFVAAPFSLLTLRRPPSRERWWVPVSGKVDPSDRSRESALRREIFEETGFAGPLRPFSLDWDVPFDGPDGRRWRLHAYGVELDGRWVPRLSDEHEGYAWLTAREALARLHFEDNREALRRLLAGFAAPAPGP